MTRRYIKIKERYPTPNKGDDNKKAKCGGKPYKWCGEHKMAECAGHHVALHPMILNVDMWNTAEDKMKRERTKAETIRSLGL